MAKIKKRRWRAPSGEMGEAWQLDYMDQHGRRHRKAFRTKKAAEDWSVLSGMWWKMP